MTVNVINRFLFWVLVRTTKGGELSMILVMASLIIYGDITIAQVPAASKGAVRAKLLALGYDETGAPLPKEE
jgi:hypothetical protein